MVHPGGRPRDVTPSPEDCIELGKDLVQWATEPTDEWRCLLSQWWCLKKKLLRSEWNSLKQCEQFLPYYQQAQASMSVKSINGTMDKSFGHRYVRLYDRELIEAENEQAKFDANLKKESNQNENDTVNGLTKLVSELCDARGLKRQKLADTKPVLDQEQAGSQDPVCS